MNDTIAYYDKNAQQFLEQTSKVDMSALYKPFLELIPSGGSILDAGCGPGRDSIFFKQQGFQVEAFDASQEICRLASDSLGQPVHQMTFEQVGWNSTFDGIWACASLLHVSKASFSSVLDRLARALKRTGVLYISVKRRDAEWSDGGRHFNGYDEKSFSHLINDQSLLRVHSMWTSNDSRPGHEGEQWLNALVKWLPFQNEKLCEQIGCESEAQRFKEDYSIDSSPITEQLTNPAKLWSRTEIFTRPCPVPRRAGVYAWYLRELPNAVDASSCVQAGVFKLLYVGISPKVPSKNGAAPSSQTLSSRIRYHYRGNASGSTLRLTLGCLLSETLGIELRRVGSGERRTFWHGEQLLSDWMAANAFVCWAECDKPWIVEEQMIKTVSLPLNLDQNKHHLFCSTLKAIRKRAVNRARELPVVR